MSDRAGSEVSARKYVGQPIKAIEDLRFVRAEGQFLDDLHIPSLNHAAFVRSPHARARIVRVESAAAGRAPGVVRVLTALDVQGRVAPIHAPIGDKSYCAPPRPVLPLDEVRFVGEPVAVVVARSMSEAMDAAELVRVEYEPLKPVVDMEAALESSAPQVHREVPGNVMFRGSHAFGDVDASFAEAAVTLRERFRIGRITGIPLEPRGCIAIPEAGGSRLTIWSSSQAPHILRTMIAECLAMPESAVRVAVPDIGGGFGIKIHVYPEDVLVAFLARSLATPVKWVQRRIEDLQASAHCREQIYELEIAARATGEFLALRARILSDNGAFALPPQGAVLQVATALRILPNAYRFAAYSCEHLTIATNKSPAGAYRGVAQPACIFAIERLVDLLAAKLGHDPAQLRLRNILADGERSIAGNDFENASFKRSLELALERVGYDRIRVEQAAHPESGLGIGIAIYPENTGLGSSGWRGRGVTRVPGFDSAHIRMLPDGTVAIASSVPAIGQGHETALAQIVAEELGIALERVHVERTDTAATPYGTGCFASRGAIAGGGAAARGARELKKKIQKLAAALLECAPEDIVLENDGASPIGVPNHRIPFAQLARVAYYLTAGPLPPGVEPGLEATAIYDPPPITFANGCHIAVVQVDRESGAVRVLRYVVAHDCGRVINPLLVAAQIQGAVVQGIGSALGEELVYDLDGQLLTASLLDYPLPRADDVPFVELVHLESPSPSTEGGFKGVGESGIIGAPAAIGNAIADALPAVGPRITAVPITPERLWRLLSTAREG